MTGSDRTELASYQLKDVARILYTQWKENRGTDAAPIIGNALVRLFLTSSFQEN